MVIQSSNVAMRGNHQYSRTNAEAVGFTGWGSTVRRTGSVLAATPSATDSEQFSGEKQEGKTSGYGALLTGMQSDYERLFVAAKDDAIYSGKDKVEYNGLKNLLMMLSGKREMSSKKVSQKDLLSQMLNQYQKQIDDAVLNIGLPGQNASVRPTQVFAGTISVRSFYEEKESMSFYSSGTVVTEDGRKIEIDLEAMMSRTFTQYTQVDIDFGAAQLMDPLVISLDGGPVGVSDQKFLFDIDCDGEMDNISLLAKGCGFLALDRNGDGKINDGSELFGTKSGNGFADLAVFDMDGNGWIDEKDEIFNRLRIWTKDESGNDKLVALGVAGIGAIYLGSTSTQFSLNSKDDNTTNAVVRSSGIYLKENGTAGMVQQVDLAVG